MKAATIRDVAERAHVSVASVSRVLTGAGAVTDATRARVMEAVDALSYVPHSGARSLSTSRTDTVGVILPDLFGEFFSELIRGMDVAARAHGLHLIVSSSHDDAADASAAIRSMRGRVDGLIVLSPHLDSANLTGNLSGRLPVLLMNGGEADSGRPSIAVDNVGGAVAAVEHLVAMGYRRIAHIGGPAGNLEARERQAGYVQAVLAAGLEPAVHNGDFTQASGHVAMTALLRGRDRPDALFAANDMMAIGALLALQEAGLRCPDDIAVVGFDDVPIAALVRPGLTTLHIDIAETGRHAMERLVRLIAATSLPDAVPDTTRETIHPRLVIRQSCGSPQFSTLDGGASAPARLVSNGE
ncbi:Catabolite control protein A [Brevundimonas subvibrioides]|jgi:LacI family transcriptional regulator|uniref:Transcriptional regulator, LacI family n=1 Tax=Brevundimonas subvibrioides (strain ATCC 15264 / DSM 4735 / LMG 14903 / NBRC 16000 / CB 81) TaxID=633149 RepID=D9QJZ6_BRESC|nr:LacI family DNA-binding transcriptional regulator [Brevundimonas subvibrioides]ADL01581.1 transcriptional regulator, LacI family [Brevundimonas subvibrioides ATCC 15264]